jgi:hypothetical protein
VVKKPLQLLASGIGLRSLATGTYIHISTEFKSIGNISLGTIETGGKGILLPPPSSEEFIGAESDSSLSIDGGLGGKTALIDFGTFIVV